eukprot:TRINITY_DN28975_c0_g1_i1.p1 TRINITY_DN28975_c0_g1~~TRINITY_DN28975_c0_g1_i1.p1  ORF type:complete len:201 (-),score=10.90 TRINITY_DN28975_c0_g1_i1:178-723(-)
MCIRDRFYIESDLSQVPPDLALARQHAQSTRIYDKDGKPYSLCCDIQELRVHGDHLPFYFMTIKFLFFTLLILHILSCMPNFILTLLIKFRLGQEFDFEDLIDGWFFRANLRHQQDRRFFVCTNIGRASLISRVFQLWCSSCTSQQAEFRNTSKTTSISHRRFKTTPFVFLMFQQIQQSAI